MGCVATVKCFTSVLSLIEVMCASLRQELWLRYNVLRDTPPSS